ncbi:glycosyltransferase family 2 protein [Candidatus Micrarchaeota archaeon]|nr:glycosyltransferase family 2 protein [Candidatus Micrarchaeota archaeon]
MDISVVIPTMNEEATIEGCIKKAEEVFKEMKLKGEVIVADNSSDGTPRIAKRLGAVVITPKKFGYGNAYLAGLDAASGKYIAMVDGDGTYDISEMEKILKPLINREADFVVGSRFKGEIKGGAMSFLHRRIGNPFFNWFLNRIYKIDISDSHCGMRAFTREAYKKMNLKTEGMEFASEMVIKAHNQGLRIKEVPISYYPRKGSKSKIKSFDDGWRHLKFMVLSSPPVIFVYPGIFLMVTGFLLLLILLGGPVILLGFPLYIHPMIFGSMFTIVGFQLYSLGLFSSIYRRRINANGKGESFFAKQFRLETGLLVGMLAFIVGLTVALMIVYRWVVSGFGPLDYQREAIVSSTLVALGVQVAFTSLFSSILSME